MRDRLVDRITRTSELFEPFTDDERRGLAAQFEVVEVDAGTRLITQGTRADGLYIVMAGHVGGPARRPRPRHALTGDVFGEMSLIAGRGSTADVVAATRLLALRMPAKTFREMIMTYPQVLAYLGELSSKRSLLKQAEDMIDLHIDMLYDSRHEPAARRLRQPARRPPARAGDRQQGRRELQERGHPPRLLAAPRVRRVAVDPRGDRRLCGGDAITSSRPPTIRSSITRRSRSTATARSIPPAPATVLGKLDDVMTGRVFAANGPWVTRDANTLRAVMPNMLAHRKAEAAYYRSLLGRARAAAAGLSLAITDNPHRWEGMADVATVGDRVVLTYAVPGHYDANTTPKSSRSTREGVAFAATAAGVPDDARIYAELVYPHFHGDTVHFGARPAAGLCRARALQGRSVRRRRAVSSRGRSVAIASCRSIATTRSSSTPATRGRSPAACSYRTVYRRVRRIDRTTRAHHAPRPAVRAVRQGRRRSRVRDPLPPPHARAARITCPCVTARQAASSRAS